MILINNKLILYHKTTLSPSLKLQLIIKRFMLRSILKQSAKITSYTTDNPYLLTHRNYPGQYCIREWRPKIKQKKDQHEINDLNLTKHQLTHKNIEETNTGIIRAIFTSCTDFEKLDPVKVDGSFIPLKDKTGKTFLNTQGNPIPDPNKGGQYIAVLETPRKVGKDVKRYSNIQTNDQAYVDKHEKDIEAIINKAKKTSLPKFIGNKDDENI